MSIQRASGRYFLNPYNNYQTMTEAVNRLSNSTIDHYVQLLVDTLIEHNKQFRILDGGLYTGHTGVSYALISAFKDEIPNKVKSFLEQSTISNLHDDTESNSISMFFGVPGRCLVLAMAAYRLGLQHEYLTYEKRLADFIIEKIHSKNKFQEEILYGRAGMLQIISTYRKIFNKELVEDKYVKKLCELIIEKGIEGARKHPYFNFPLVYKFHNQFYLGMAHGVCGVLVALLGFVHLLNANSVELLKNAVEKCMSLQDSSGNFPTTFERVGAQLVHWCHGAPGFVQMFVKAFEVWKDERFRLAAKLSAQVTFERGLLRKGPGLCHGVSGNGYAFLLVRKIIDDPKEREKYIMFAQCFADFIINNEEFKRKAFFTPDNPYSLYEGCAAVVCFLRDLQNPDNATFPLFS